jgi:hypothetical protein
MQTCFVYDIELRFVKIKPSSILQATLNFGICHDFHYLSSSKYTKSIHSFYSFSCLFYK